MPHKLEHWESYNEPYGESYSPETGFWYDDDTEEFPEPAVKSTDKADLKITPIITESDMDLLHDDPANE